MSKCMFILIFIATSGETISYENNRGITIELSRMHFTNKEYQINYELNTTQYHETTFLVKDCIKQIAEMCNDSENRFCYHFLMKTKKFHGSVKFDNRYIKFHKKSKRIPLLIIAIPFIVGVMTMALLQSLAQNRAAMKTVKSELSANFDILQQAINTTHDTLLTHEEILGNLERGITNLTEALNRLNDKVDRNRYFSDILNIILFTMIEHNEFQEKLLKLYEDDDRADVFRKTDVFRIIDFGEFCQTLEEINATLDHDREIIPITFGKRKFVTSSIEQQANDISILLNVPIVEKTENIIYEFIPIPFKQADQLYILDSNAMGYFMSEDGEKLAYSESNMECKTLENYTLCNNIYRDTLDTMSECLQSIDTENIPNSCNFKPIKEKNYAIRISKTALFYYVVQPITLQLICRGYESEIHLNCSQLIEHDENCRLYGPSSSNSESFKYKHINLNLMDDHPTIHKFNVSPKKWIDEIEILSKYELQLIEAHNKFTKLESDALFHKEIVDNIEADDIFSNILEFFSLENFLPVKYFKIGIYILCTLLLLYIFKNYVLPIFHRKSS